MRGCLTVAVFLTFVLPWRAQAQDNGEWSEALSFLEKHTVVRTADVGIHLARVRTGETVFGRDAAMPLIPASTAKVFTTAAAIRELGPGWRFETAFVSAVRPNGSGVLPGDLYLVGSGDPGFVVEDLYKLVRDLRNVGVDRVSGRLLLDHSETEAPGWIPGWDNPEDEEKGPAYYASLGALSINFNAAEIVVAPGAKSGDAGRVGLGTEASDYLSVRNEVKTVGRGEGTSVRVARELGDGMVTYVAKGTIEVGAKPRWRYRSVPDPTAYVAAALSDLLKKEGISVDGGFARGEAPDECRQLVSRSSDPLVTMLGVTNKYSSNIYAEQLLRAVGGHSGEAASTLEGLGVIDAYLSSLGIAANERILANGSGLSRDTKVSARALTSVLVDMAQDATVYPEFSASLAIGGVDGTLRKRLDASDGLLRAKTGSLDGAQSLAGYVEDADGEVYAFAFLVNGFRGSSAKVRGLQDRFVSEVFGVSTREEDAPEGTGGDTTDN